jgi:hypothetical protein
VRGAIPESSKTRPLLALALLLLLNGCAAGWGGTVGRFQPMDPPLKTIALAPNGGIFADLIGIELSEQGYTIVDTGATLALLVFMQRTQDDLLSPEIMAMFKGRGIDAVLVVQKVDGTDGLPQTVHMRLYSTTSSAEVGGLEWGNSWIRRGVLESAQAIAAAMSKGLRGEEGRGSSASETEMLM